MSRLKEMTTNFKKVFSKYHIADSIGLFAIFFVEYILWLQLYTFLLKFIGLIKNKHIVFLPIYFFLFMIFAILLEITIDNIITLIYLKKQPKNQEYREVLDSIIIAWGVFFIISIIVKLTPISTIIFKMIFLVIPTIAILFITHPIITILTKITEILDRLTGILDTFEYKITRMLYNKIKRNKKPIGE
ncbi:MAG: hypothetical protein LBS34_00230 [Rickettsiales bacterium]|jgi:hypothetical protein|nr:hypothetical protein [Rickettsiales bacterium]